MAASLSIIVSSFHRMVIDCDVTSRGVTSMTSFFPNDSGAELFTDKSMIHYLTMNKEIMLCIENV